MMQSKLKPKEAGITGDACHLRRTSELPNRAKAAHMRLSQFQLVMKTLLSDEHFLTLLRAESMETLPAAMVAMLAQTGGILWQEMLKAFEKVNEQ